MLHLSGWKPECVLIITQPTIVSPYVYVEKYQYVLLIYSTENEINIIQENDTGRESVSSCKVLHGSKYPDVDLVFIENY